MNDHDLVERPRVLMVVFEFPPSNGSSVQRITSVYREFVAAGWEVDVLTAAPFAYPNKTKTTTAPTSSKSGQVIRAWALDVMRHLSFKGKHLGWLLNPDRWGKTWIPFASWLGARHVKKYPPDLIWSSAPTPSPHVVAAKLANQTGCRWVADYRDPMPYLHRPRGRSVDRRHRAIDMQVLRNADLLTFATENIRDLYVQMDPQSNIKRFHVMPNGFDDELMARAQEAREPSVLFKKGCISLYYAGVLYNDGRNPCPLFEALGLLKKNHPNIAVEMVFQGAGDGREFAPLLKNLQLEENVRFVPGVDYPEALNNMLSADGLVLIQDEQFNQQIPGKVYEYLATQKALWVKTPYGSATERLLNEEAGVFSGYAADTLYDALFRLVSAHLDDDGCLIKRSNFVEYHRDVSSHARSKHAKQLVHWASDLLWLKKD